MLCGWAMLVRAVLDRWDQGPEAINWASIVGGYSEARKSRCECWRKQDPSQDGVCPLLAVTFFGTGERESRSRIANELFKLFGMSRPGREGVV